MRAVVFGGSMLLTSTSNIASIEAVSRHTEDVGWE
jgi:hypothetical protein